MADRIVSFPRDGGVCAVKVADLSGAELAAGRDAARRLVDDVQLLRPGWSRDECVALVVVLLAEWEADEQAYRRVCERKGVLAL